MKNLLAVPLFGTGLPPTLVRRMLSGHAQDATPRFSGMREGRFDTPAQRDRDGLSCRPQDSGEMSRGRANARFWTTLRSVGAGRDRGAKHLALVMVRSVLAVPSERIERHRDDARRVAVREHAVLAVRVAVRHRVPGGEVHELEAASSWGPEPGDLGRGLPARHFSDEV